MRAITSAACALVLFAQGCVAFSGPTFGLKGREGPLQGAWGARSGSLKRAPIASLQNPDRRRAAAGAVAISLPFLFPGQDGSAAVNAAKGTTGPTNQIVGEINGIRQKRLGGGDIIVSEIGLGTQRWVSADFNAPDEALCRKIMDRAILDSGVNLIDTAEQYPIPSDMKRPEGLSEEVIGRWMGEKGRREKVVLATKITGGGRITGKNIITACEGSLRRLQTDYIDVYQFHWPARYTPQANWGQSLMYRQDFERRNAATNEEQCIAMDKLVKEGKIRGWGMCNDNAYGITVLSQTAKRLGTTPPVVLQGDFSMINRRIEENGVTEASSPINENVGFLGYNILAGGFLTGKYLEGPAPAWEDYARDQKRAIETARSPRGRHDDLSWGSTLYRYRSYAAKDAVLRYQQLAKKYKMPLTELAVRWTKERQGMTSALLGSSSLEQLDQCLGYFKNKDRLDPRLMQEIDAVHMRNRLPIFSSDRVGADWDGEGEIGEPVP